MIIGYDAVYAYNDGQTSLEALSRLGQVKFFKFTSVRQLTAFITGLEIGVASLDALAVDDLTI